MKAKRNTKAVAARSDAAPPIPAEPLVEVALTPEIMEAARAYYNARWSISDFGFIPPEGAYLRLTFLSDTGCAKAHDTLREIEAASDDWLIDVIGEHRNFVAGLRHSITKGGSIQPGSEATSGGKSAKRNSQLLETLADLETNYERLQRSVKHPGKSMEKTQRTLWRLRAESRQAAEQVEQFSQKEATAATGSAASPPLPDLVIFERTILQVDESTKCAIHKVPTGLFVSGPIWGLCWRLGASNANPRRLPLKFVERRGLALLDQLYNACHLLMWDFEPCESGNEETSYVAQSELQSDLQKCFDQMRRFAELVLQALPGPDSLAAMVPVETPLIQSSPSSMTLGPPPELGDAHASPTVSTAEGASKTQPPSPPTKEGQKPDSPVSGAPESESALAPAPAPPEDPQTFVARITKAVPDPSIKWKNCLPCKVQMSLQGPADKDPQPCGETDSQTLLALYCVLGKSGKSGDGGTDKRTFVELCYNVPSKGYSCNDITAGFEWRLGKSSALKKLTGLTKKKAAKYHAVIIGPRFVDPQLTQEEAKAYLRASERTEIGSRKKK